MIYPQYGVGTEFLACINPQMKCICISFVVHQKYNQFIQAVKKLVSTLHKYMI